MMNSISKNKRGIITKAKHIAWSVVRGVIITGICYIILYPLLIKVLDGFKSYNDLIDPNVNFFPRRLTLEYYQEVIQLMDYKSSVLNTLLISFVFAFLTTAVAVLAGYGFARYKFKGSNILFVLVILMLLVPPEVILVPLYTSFKSFFGFNLLNTPWPLFIMAITGTGYRSGLFIFLTRQAFTQVPKELSEAARIDGCNEFGIFYKVMLPSASTIMTTVFLLSFSWQWTDDIFSSLFLRSADILTNVVNRVTNDNWYLNMSMKNSATILIILPLLVLYIIGQKGFTQTVDSSGLTG